VWYDSVARAVIDGSEEVNVQAGDKQVGLEMAGV